MCGQEDLPAKPKEPAPCATENEATVLPFPLVRRRAFIVRHAERLITLPSKTAEKHLAYAIRVQAHILIKRGFATTVITEQVKSLEDAIRAEVSRKMVAPGGAA